MLKQNNNDISNLFIKSLFTKDNKTVTAYFKNGLQAQYSYNIEMIELLKSDNEIDYIINNETGEVIMW